MIPLLTLLAALYIDGLADNDRFDDRARKVEGLTGEKKAMLFAAWLAASKLQIHSLHPPEVTSDRGAVISLADVRQLWELFRASSSAWQSNSYHADPTWTQARWNHMVLHATNRAKPASMFLVWMGVGRPGLGKTIRDVNGRLMVFHDVQAVGGGPLRFIESVKPVRFATLSDVWPLVDRVFQQLLERTVPREERKRRLLFNKSFGPTIYRVDKKHVSSSTGMSMERVTEQAQVDRLEGLGLEPEDLGFDADVPTDRLYVVIDADHETPAAIILGTDGERGIHLDEVQFFSRWGTQNVEQATKPYDPHDDLSVVVSMMQFLQPDLGQWSESLIPLVMYADLDSDQQIVDAILIHGGELFKGPLGYNLVTSDDDVDRTVTEAWIEAVVRGGVSGYPGQIAREDPGGAPGSVSLYHVLDGLGAELDNELDEQLPTEYRASGLVTASDGSEWHVQIQSFTHFSGDRYEIGSWETGTRVQVAQSLSELDPYANTLDTGPNGYDDYVDMRRLTDFHHSSEPSGIASQEDVTRYIRRMVQYELGKRGIDPPDAGSIAIAQRQDDDWPDLSDLKVWDDDDLIAWYNAELEEDADEDTDEDTDETYDGDDDDDEP